MRTTDFNFYLPDDLIAQFPTAERGASRLLRLNGKDGSLEDTFFNQLPKHLKKGDVLIFNDTRVIKARLAGVKSTGGTIEVMIERILGEYSALAHIRASKSPKVGSMLRLADAFDVEVTARQDDLFVIKIHHEQNILTLLSQYGSLPLPPYITHQADSTDEERYQTVYAKNEGAVAAPTAGLHFDDAMLNHLQSLGIQIAYVTLHVGAGTFQPVRVDNISEHKMHSELYEIPQATVDAIHEAQASGGVVTAVGTTALRALESAARTGTLLAGHGETDIFITPGYEFKVVERLLTNFHLPKSTLLMLISAFAGFDFVMKAYEHAVLQRYRFFSYGDAMLIERA